MCIRKSGGKALARNERKGKQDAVGKGKKGKMKLHTLIKNRLAKKGARAEIIIKYLANDRMVVWKPAILDRYAEELRYLAFQIRNLQNAKVATEEA